MMAGFAFVLAELASLGWWPFDERSVSVITIDSISEEALPLGYRAGMLNAWVHNLRVGQVVNFHSHPTRAEMVVILRGRARVRGLRAGSDGGAPRVREERLGPGSMIFSPPGSIHEYTNISDQPLWTLVFMSPPVKQNVYLEAETPTSDKDFLVIPLRAAGAVRGAFVPDWAKFDGPLWRGEIGYYPAIPGRVLRGASEIRGRESGIESWIILIEGAGTLQIGDTERAVKAPTWFTTPDGSWTLRGDRVALLAIEFSLPNFEIGLFVRALIERYGPAPMQAWLGGAEWAEASRDF